MLRRTTELLALIWTALTEAPTSAPDASHDAPPPRDAEDPIRYAGDPREVYLA